MKKSLVKVQVPVSSDYTDEHLKFIKQMGVDNCFVMFTDQDSNYDGVNKFLERCRKAGLTVNDAGNAHRRLPFLRRDGDDLRLLYLCDPGKPIGTTCRSFTRSFPYAVLSRFRNGAHNHKLRVPYIIGNSRPNQ